MEYSLQIWIAYRSMHMESVIGIKILKLRCSDISCYRAFPINAHQKKTM